MEYKFRGVSKRTDDVIFGFGLIRTDNYDYDILLTGEKKSARIVKHSGARLLGYDENGSEVYEGDIVTDGVDDTLVAKEFENQIYDEVYSQFIETEFCTLVEAVPYEEDY